MQKKYDRKVPIDYWLIQLEDINRVYNFISSRIKLSNIEAGKEPSVTINLELQSGDTYTYESFEELKEDAGGLKDLLHQGEIIESLRVASSVNDSVQHRSMHIWLEVKFNSHFASSYIYINAKDNDGGLMDSVLGCVNGAQKTLALFTVEDKILKVLKARFPKSQEQIIVFDIFGEIRKSILEELDAAERIVADQKITTERLTKGEKFSKFLREHWIASLITIAGGVATIISLLKG